MDDIKIFIGGLLFLCLITFGVNSFNKSQVRISCQNFGVISNRETKYVEYTYWNYACITPDKDGKWIDTSLLRSLD